MQPLSGEQMAAPSPHSAEGCRDGGRGPGPFQPRLGGELGPKALAGGGKELQLKWTSDGALLSIISIYVIDVEFKEHS